MSWKAVLRNADGECLSVGTVVAGRLPAGCVVVDLPREPLLDAEQWDPVLRAFVPRPPDATRQAVSRTPTEHGTDVAQAAVAAGLIASRDAGALATLVEQRMKG